MDDLERYINKRKKNNRDFATNFEERYENYKIGILLKQARQEAGLTQEEIAEKLKTKKSAISRIENHSEDIRLSTLKNYVEALGKKLQLIIN
jgi:ribosome-binding protein aMBF1 (putative translation factor)